jgi:dUTP pyrophosphatase
MKLRVMRIDENAKLPTYATDGSGCLDFYTTERGILLPGAERRFKTGIAVEVPKTHVLLLFSRSGHGFKNRSRLTNCVGVIDSDYRGEIMVSLTNDTEFGDMRREMNTLRVAEGDRIAQGALFEVPKIEVEEVAQLSETARGAGGFGSTGQ